MKFFMRRAILLSALTLIFVPAFFGQEKMSKEELFNKIAKATKAKVPEERAKGYELAKTYLAQYGKDNDDGVKKIKAFVDDYRRKTLNDAVDSNKPAEAIALGKEILAENPNDTVTKMNLAYGIFNTYLKTGDKTYAADAVDFAKQTLAAFDAGNLPKNYEPLKSKDEMVALMHYTIGALSPGTDPKFVATEFYKATLPVSQFKNNSYPYYSVANYYEKLYVQATKDFADKYGTQFSDTPETKAAQDNIAKILDRMLDAYVRAVNIAKNEPNNQNRAGWEDRILQVYNFRYKKTDGYEDFVRSILAAPFPDPGVL